MYFAVYSDDSPLTISKQDVTTGTELPGASLVLKDKLTGTVIESWTSSTAPHKVANIAAMTPGREYVLCETIAPANYAVAQDVDFVYTGTAGQQVTMYNELHGVVRVYKTGPALSGTTAYQVNAGGKNVTVNRMDFSAEAFANVSFNIYNARTNALVATITTDGSGYATSDLLPCGQGETYYMVETGTPAGAVMEESQIPVTIAFDNANNTYVAPVTLDNGATSVKISVYKEGELVLPNVEEDGTITYGKKPIEGVYYGLYTGEEIQLPNGTIAKDTLVAIGKTNEQGVCVIEEAVVAGKYYVQEISAPEGFVVDDTKHEVNVTYTANSSEPVKEIELNKTSPYLNKYFKTGVELCKVDENGDPVLGEIAFALFRKGSDGKYIQVGSYKTDATTGKLVIDNCPYGEYYFIETSGLNGYVYDGQTKHEFEVTGKEDTNKLITVTAVNEIVKARVELSKVDDSKAPIGGVEFSLFRKGSDGKFVEIGKYTTDAQTGKIVIENCPFGEYYFQETKGVEGFSFDAEKKYKFEISGTEEITDIITIEVVNHKTPLTGDNLPIFGIGLIMLLSLAGGIFFMVRRKKRI